MLRGPHLRTGDLNKKTSAHGGEFFSSQVLLLRYRCRVDRELGLTRVEVLQ